MNQMENYFPQDVYEGFYESRLKILMAMWEKGKEISLRRIGELMPGEGHGGKREKGQVQEPDLIIPKQRLSEFRKLAEIPDRAGRENKTQTSIVRRTDN